MNINEVRKIRSLRAVKLGEKIKNQIRCLLVEYRVIFIEEKESTVANFDYKSKFLNIKCMTMRIMQLCTQK